MITFIRYGLLLACIFALSIAHANTIDSLKTKEDVRKFLLANVDKYDITGVGFTPIELDSSDHFHKTNHGNLFLIDGGSNKNFFGRHKFDFVKVDIDGDGRTDLIVDTGIIIIILDKGDKFELHMFSLSPYSYTFNGTLPMPDGSIALLLGHDLNTDSYKPDSVYRHSTITYKTDTLTDRSILPPSVKVDTLYRTIKTLIVDSIFTYKPVFRPGSFPNFKDSILLCVPDSFDHLRIDTDVIVTDMKLHNNIDTIVYKFNAFVEYDSHFKPTKVSRIDYRYYVSTDMITRNGNALIVIDKKGECFMHSDFIRHASSVGLVDSASLQDLWNLISYIDVKSKKDDYKMAVDHDAGTMFTIYFEDGSAKTIETFGRCNIIGLRYLSREICNIFKLSQRQESKSH